MEPLPQYHHHRSSFRAVLQLNRKMKLTTLRGLAVLALLVLAPCARALVWTGSITQTVTSTTDPTYAIGQTFVGSYTYTSDTADGTFIARPLFNWAYEWKPNAESLNGSIFMHFPPGVGFDRFAALIDTMYTDNYITVLGGVVTGFQWQFYKGAYYIGFKNFEGRSSIDPNPINPRIYTVSSLSFSAPRTVPESGSVIALLAGSIGLLMVAHRQRLIAKSGLWRSTRQSSRRQGRP